MRKLYHKPIIIGYILRFCEKCIKIELHVDVQALLAKAASHISKEVGRDCTFRNASRWTGFGFRGRIRSNPHRTLHDSPREGIWGEPERPLQRLYVPGVEVLLYGLGRPDGALVQNARPVRPPDTSLSEGL